MTIQASVSGGPQIAATVSEMQIATSVSPASSVAASVSGGIGPTGVTTLSGASDAVISSAADGDVLRYSSGKWRNYPEANLVDGGNW